MDDLISSGGTMTRAAGALRRAGAEGVIALAAHGLFDGDAAAKLEDPKIDRWLVTDTVPPFRLPSELAELRLEVVSAAPLFAEAVRRLHEDGSLVGLIEGESSGGETGGGETGGGETGGGEA